MSDIHLIGISIYGMFGIFGTRKSLRFCLDDLRVIEGII